METERLILRTLEQSDFSSLYDVLGDSDIMRHYPYTFDETRVKNWILCNQKRYQIFGFGLFAVVKKETNELIGDCGLTMQNIHGFISPEIGYHIKHCEQKKGYAKEAGKMIRDWTFTHTPFQTIFSYMETSNIASQKTAQSLGMKKVEEYVTENKEEITVYAITKQDWKIQIEDR
jgi:RimJ/RimL family protein N-acetyltransferase